MTLDEELQQKVEKALRGLGNTAEEVRDSLIKKGIRGIAHDCAKCPIAVFLNREFPEQGSFFEVGLSGWDKNNLEVYGNLPEAVMGFVQCFDNGEMRKGLEKYEEESPNGLGDLENVKENFYICGV